MKKTVAVLLLCLCLSACGAPSGDSGASLLGRASGLDEELCLLTVDGRTAPALR